MPGERKFKPGLNLPLEGIQGIVQELFPVDQVLGIGKAQVSIP